LITPRHVVTVEHVVDGASKITLERSRNRLGSARLVGIDKDRDLALLRLEKPIKGYLFRFAKRPPRLGEEVAALGYPLGLPLSVTRGTVSGLNRTIAIDGVKRRALVQTDAAVNHGNSGGPLLSTSTGEVVGLVDLGSTDVNGIAFAVSSAVAAPLVSAWRAAPQPHALVKCQNPSADPSLPAPPAGTDPRSVGVPASYRGRFTSVDRLQRCYATNEFVYCASGPSRKAAQLMAGGTVAEVSPAEDASDHGGPSMPMGTQFETPAGTIRCDSSTRGITCEDLANGNSFTIGDYKLIVRAGASGSGSQGPGFFASVDRLQRCFLNDDYAICNSGPSGQAVSIAADGLAVYEGITGSRDRGGPALSFGQTVTNPTGSIACESSSRGITCTNTLGSRFVIGDHYVRVMNGGREERYEN
jgi:hypothetical protein